jgi:hypothetical protein
VLVAAACTLVLSACGGSDSSSGSTASTAPPADSKAKAEASQESKTVPGSKAPLEAKTEEPSADFAGKGKNGELAEAGTESTVSEREAASKIVEASFEAAEAEDWARQCATFSLELAESIEKRSKLSGRISCAKSIEQLARENGGALKNPMAGSLAALRVNGNQAFAFFRGAGERHFVIPLAREDGQWRLVALLPEETP